MPNDPIIQAAADLQKEMADVDCPEMHKAMEEIMKLILGATKPTDDRKAPARRTRA